MGGFGPLAATALASALATALASALAAKLQSTFLSTLSCYYSSSGPQEDPEMQSRFQRTELFLL